ncbi:DUF2339 domain-containing protein [soil metagenome]
MPETPDQLNQLMDKLNILMQRQQQFTHEINALRAEIYSLQVKAIESRKVEIPKTEQVVPVSNFRRMDEPVEVLQNLKQPIAQPVSMEPVLSSPIVKPGIVPDLEKFIGENLINKVGIAITIIGVAIGAKYSIEHDLISPATRIILGYLMGIALLAFGIKLKLKYESFSAVLVSGAMAIMYFITYAAYSFYALMPQSVAFLLMVILTVSTVIAAIKYNRQVIAHIGLVGAYAVPFLLGDDSGKVAILFSYIVIINIGILVISFKKYWKSLSYVSFLLTWLIFSSWYFARYNEAKHFQLALGFATAYFFIFYTSFLAYKLLRQEKFGMGDIILILFNSFIFYGIGYNAIEQHWATNTYLSMFTIANAIVHFLVSMLVYKQKLADRNLFYLLMGLSIVFVTITIPVQFDGNWVTLFWAGEAALLFWIGRTKSNYIYEQLSYPLMLLAFISLLQDWFSGYLYFDSPQPADSITPLFNINFASSLLFVGCFGLINYISINKKYALAYESKQERHRIFAIAIPAILLISLYYTFYFEIALYWNQLYQQSIVTASPASGKYAGYSGNEDLLSFKAIWLINYSLLFVTLLSFVNIKRIKNELLGFVNISLNTLAIAVFLLLGLSVLADLRESYLGHLKSAKQVASFFNIGVRYACYVFVALTVYAIYQYIHKFILRMNFQLAFNGLLHITILWIASSELINWMELANSSQSYKLGLSILWGIYALMIIAIGIAQKKKHLRVGAIALFAVTLLKLFLYDIADLDTIAKTIVFVSLGILLLVISFLYNKYKSLIARDDD